LIKHNNTTALIKKVDVQEMFQHQEMNKKSMVWHKLNWKCPWATFSQQKRELYVRYMIYDQEFSESQPKSDPLPNYISGKGRLLMSFCMSCCCSCFQVESCPWKYFLW